LQSSALLVAGKLVADFTESIVSLRYQRQPIDVPSSTKDLVSAATSVVRRDCALVCVSAAHRLQRSLAGCAASLGEPRA